MMSIFGLNSPEVFVILLITLIILGTKRIEKGLFLFSRLLKFLLNNKSGLDNMKAEVIIKKEKTTNSKDKEPSKDIDETQKKAEVTIKKEKTTNSKDKEPSKEVDET